MTHLLQIDSSALSAGSVSKEIAETFRASWDAAHPQGTVTRRDLGQHPVPPIAEAALLANYTPADQHTAEQAAAAAFRNTLVQEVLDADAYLFTIPMYNWGVPAGFKAWIDQVLVGGRTLTFDGNPPLGGRPATVILAYGGGYDAGSPREGWDFVQPYLETVLGKALGLDVTFIKAQLTLAESNPAMADLIPLAKEIRAAAHTTAHEHAQSLAARIAA